MPIRLMLAVLLLSLSSLSQAQEFSGKWSGFYTYGNDEFEYDLVIHQEKSLLTGFASTKFKKDSAKYYLKGTLENGEAILSAHEYVYKKGIRYCLPKLKLKLEGDSIIGTYGGNGVWGGCLPIVKGNIGLKRINHTNPVISQPESEETFVIEDDAGIALLEELKTRKYHALIIATNEYPDPDIPTLSKPIADADLLQETLNKYYSFNVENITFLKNPTRVELIEAFDKLANEVSKRDNFLIFYAGHGIWDGKLKQGFWLPTDASKNSKAQWLSNSTIRDYIRGIESKHTLLITDACFGGSILKERAINMNGRAMLEMYKRPSRKAMTSGALSTVPDESVFIKYLVKTLKNNQSPLISAEQLFGDFKIAVINNSITSQVPQYGAISLAGDEGGDFIFLKRD